MPDVEVQAPEIDDIDEQASPFKRLIAVLVVTITLLASILAYLHAVESNKEERAAREAQRFAVSGLGAQVDASADFQRAYAVYTQSELLDSQQVIAAGRERQSGGSPRGELYALDAQRAAAVKAALVGTSPLLEGEFSEENDPNFPFAFDAEVTVGPDEARLRQEAQAELADDHGSKADTFVAILTVLAVSLFLLGLSLTVEGRSRRLLVIPGVGIAVICLGWAVITAAREVPRTPERAIRAVAEGNRLVTRGDPEAAVEEFSRAIELRPDYATAFGLRADAHFLAGSDQLLSGFISITDPENLARAIEDSEKAVELGAGDDVGVVGGLGFYHFLEGDLGAAERLTDQALDLNDRLPALWFNAGVIEVAQGDDDTADEYYEVGLDLIRAEPDPNVQSQVLSGARVDLGIARDLAEDIDDLAAEMEAKLTAAQLELVLPDLEPAQGASVDDVAVAQDGIFLNLTGTVDGIEEGDPLAAIWYFRPDGDQPFSQPAAMNRFFPFEAIDGADGLSHFVVNGLCVTPGEYRVELFSGDELLATGGTEVTAGSLGEQVNDSSPLLSFEVCRPTDWTALESVEEGTFFVGDEEGTAGMTVGVVSVGAEVLAEGTDALVEQTITGAASGFGTVDGPAEQQFVGNLDALTVFAFADDGSVSSVSAGLDEAGVLRVVIASADDATLLDAIHAELFPGIFFTDLE